MQPRQRDAVEQVLRLWDQNLQLTDNRWLAYMLASAYFQSTGVPLRAGQCLSEKCALFYSEKLAAPFLAAFPNVEWLVRKMQEMQADAELQANGNRYYERGVDDLKGPDSYRRVQEITGEPLYDHPDLLLAPDVAARVLFGIFER